MVKKELTEAEIAESIPDLWQPLTETQRAYLAQNFTIQKYKKNEVIYCEGETPQYLMCLLSGKVKIYKDGVGGRSQIIRVVKNKEYFAYRAYFAEENFVTAAAAFEPCTMCLVPMPVVIELVRENADLAMFFIRQLSKDLGIADSRTVNLTQKHIRGRLAESLLFLKDTYGLEEDGCTISIYLSREDLANLSNMTTSNAIRTLSNFAAEKLIIIDGRKIKIVEGMDLVTYFLRTTIQNEYLGRYPNTYDNNKLLYVWHMLGCILVAQLLVDASLKIRSIPWRSLALGCTCVIATLGSVLTVTREVFSDYQHWSADEVALAQYIRENAASDALLLTSDSHTTPVFSLAGRRILCGSGSYVYYHGMDYTQEANAMHLLYEAPDESLLAQWGVDYVLFDSSVNAEFTADESWYAARYLLWYQNDSCRVYQITE